MIKNILCWLTLIVTYAVFLWLATKDIKHASAGSVLLLSLFFILLTLGWCLVCWVLSSAMSWQRHAEKEIKDLEEKVLYLEERVLYREEEKKKRAESLEEVPSKEG